MTTAPNLSQLTQVIATDPDSVLFEVAFGIRRIDKLDFRSAEFSPELMNHLKADAFKWLSSLDDRAMIAYEIGNQYHASADIQYIPISATPIGSTLLIKINPISQTRSRQVDEPFLEQVNVTVAAATLPDDKQVTLIRQTTRAFLLRRSGRQHRILFRNGTFDALNEEIIQFDTKYDCLVWDGHVFIDNLDKFELLFDYAHLKQEHASNVIEALVDALPLSNPETLMSTYLSDRRYYKKLSSVHKRGIYHKIPIARIEQLAIERKLPIEFVTDSKGDRQFCFDPSPTGRRHLLAILDDDHVKSELTTNLYESTSKRDVG